MGVKTKWIEDELGSFQSQNISVMDFGSPIPRYFIAETPNGEGWSIGVFNSLKIAYQPLLETEEKLLLFPTAQSAMEYVDHVLQSN